MPTNDTQLRYPGRGPVLNLPHPDALTDLSLAGVLAPRRLEHERLSARGSELRRELNGLVAGERDAVASDRKVAAVAMREGKADPGDRAVKERVSRIAAVRRDVEIVAAALGSLRADTLADVAVHRDEWLLEVDAALAADRMSCHEALHAYVAARQRMAERQGLLSWVVAPDRRGKVVLGKTSLKTSALGETYDLSVVLSALESELEPVERLPMIARSEADKPVIGRGIRTFSHENSMPPVRTDASGHPWAPGIVPFNR